MAKKRQSILHLTINIAFYFCVIGIVWIVLQVFFFASFKIPSDSMEPSLYAGDNVLVSKLIPGPRLFNLYATLREEQVEIYRAPGIRKIWRNEVVVCHSTHPKGWDKIEMHILKYYIKRCIGLPGDSVEIRNGFYCVRGVEEALGNQASQAQMSVHRKEEMEDVIYRAYPFDSIMDWNVKDFGPLYLPKKGDTIAMNRTNYLLYKQAIEWEQKGRLDYRDTTVYLNDKRIDAYCFLKNYYFMAGDRTDNSRDSRYWGLLPEEYIVGKAWIIWKSTDPYTGKFRWKRFLKRIV
jgi:signal peptidase I